MYGLQILSLPPAAQLVAEFAALQEDLSSFQEPLEAAVREVGVPAVGRNFDMEGPGWDPLQGSTVMIRGSEHPILEVTGALREDATSPDAWMIDDDMAAMSQLSLDYGYFHETGTSFMPARPFMDLDEGDVDSIVEVFEQWLDTKFISAGFDGGGI
jgi:phage gpG-like protein